ITQFFSYRDHFITTNSVSIYGSASLLVFKDKKKPLYGNMMGVPENRFYGPHPHFDHNEEAIYYSSPTNPILTKVDLSSKKPVVTHLDLSEIHQDHLNINHTLKDKSCFIQMIYDNHKRILVFRYLNLSGKILKTIETDKDFWTNRMIKSPNNIYYFSHDSGFSSAKLTPPSSCQ
ncbi:MAG: hypothetical protein ACPGJV_14150, partial [Bacteriovoracaceae bacterium]